MLPLGALSAPDLPPRHALTAYCMITFSRLHGQPNQHLNILFSAAHLQLHLRDPISGSLQREDRNTYVERPGELSVYLSNGRCGQAVAAVCSRTASQDSREQS